jgi:hypothetical protein
LKSLLKSIFRPFFRLTQRILVRALSPSMEPILQEVRHLRSDLEHSEQHPMFGIDPVRCYRPFTRQEFTSAAREDARTRLGVPKDRHLVISLGTVALGKGIIETLYALDQLRYWGVSPVVYFVGRIDPESRPQILGTAAGLSLLDSVHFHEEKCSNQTYRDYLIAADCALQLQVQEPGAFSGAYLDAISAGLPTVSNIGLAAVMNTPSFVRTIPDELSPLLIAEELLAFHQAWDSEGTLETARHRNLTEHAMTNYSPQILKLLLAS